MRASMPPVVAFALLCALPRAQGIQPAATRRVVINGAGAAAGSAFGLLGVAHADVAAPEAAAESLAAPRVAATEALTSVSWAATDGFDSDFPSPISFIEFDDKAYKAMRDDARRTPKFAKAIAARLAAHPGELTVLDLGTGPYAVLALIAAKYGAKKVYAVEANPEAARRARALIYRCETGDRGADGYFPLKPGQVVILDGFSTALELPEKVDLVVAEICGSIASEEGLYATMRDARERHVKYPDSEDSYIPRRCQTFAAPVSYALHSLLEAPAFDWGKVVGNPIRFNCRDEALQLLAAPQLLEDIDFSKPLPAPGKPISRSVSFEVDAGVLANTEKKFALALKEERQLSALVNKTDDIPRLSKQLSTAFSGMALWPTLVLDGETSVRSRGPVGEHQKSHWQTVLELMAAAPVAVRAGDRVEIDFDVTLENDVTKPLRYDLRGKVVRA
ncbi:S-adenosyl-L-methionine-dependent methyltransferase [Pelagophyceae sp. CCMP2097]|nr:S-adenosyl-L-methionine-dependent methyltransferase [Pelagophyceae sp. CCMP2097]